MPDNPVPIETEVQQILDELLINQLIPFPLNVKNITKAPTEYIIYFSDSRLFSVAVPLTPGRTTRELVQSAVLDSVAKLSGKLKWPGMK